MSSREYCHNCGAEITGVGRYCTECGAEQPRETETQSQAPTQKQQQRNSPETQSEPESGGRQIQNETENTGYAERNQQAAAGALLILIGLAVLGASHSAVVQYQSVIGQIAVSLSEGERLLYYLAHIGRLIGGLMALAGVYEVLDI